MAIDKTMKDKLTDSEKKKIKQENKAKANRNGDGSSVLSTWYRVCGVIRGRLYAEL